MAEVEKRANLSKQEKAAILVSALGGDLSRRILENLSSESAKKVEGLMDAVGSIPNEIVDEISNEFFRYVLKKHSSRSLPLKGETPAEEEGLLGEESGKSLADVLQGMESKVLADFAKWEHPQAIALILAHLDAAKAGEVLSGLPEALQSDVILRVAQLETVPPSVMKEVAAALEDQVQSMGTAGRKIGGVKTVANILNQTQKNLEKNILGKLEEADPELADKIKQNMFIFEDLVKVDDRGIRELLKEITSQELALALKAASDEIKEKVFRNLSERAAEMLREDIEALGPTRLSDVEKAQQAITRACLKLEGEGKIIVGGRGKEEVLV